jgi:hypothetical protein
MSERHSSAGRKGGETTFARHGKKGMRAAGKLGGRPPWQETLAKAEERRLEARKRARSRGNK